MQRLSLVPARGAVGRAAPRGTTIIAKRVVVGAARRLAGVVLVDAWGAYDGEPPQHVARGGAERDHREVAHDAGLRTRAPPVLVCFEKR